MSWGQPLLEIATGMVESCILTERRMSESAQRAKRLHGIPGSDMDKQNQEIESWDLGSYRCVKASTVLTIMPPLFHKKQVLSF
jgi:hypothetical protein